MAPPDSASGLTSMARAPRLIWTIPSIRIALRLPCTSIQGDSAAVKMPGGWRRCLSWSTTGPDSMVESAVEMLVCCRKDFGNLEPVRGR